VFQDVAFLPLYMFCK